MSAIKSALTKVRQRLSPSPSPTGSTHSLPNGFDVSSRVSKELERVEQKRDVERKQAEEDRKRKEAFDKAYKSDPEEIRARYGELPLVEKQEKKDQEKITFDISNLSLAEFEGKQISFRARIHTNRAVSPKLTFIVLRQQLTTIQGVLHQDNNVSKTFMEWAEHLKPESFVLVRGTIKKPQETVQSTTFHDLELQLDSIHLIASPSQSLPFTVYNDELSKNPGDSVHHITDHTRLEPGNRIVDLRTPISQSIFRVQSRICSAFRSHLDSHRFIEIHTPKLQGGATESGSSVFPVKYFGRKAFLAQSPQLSKQMSMSADFGRVFEVGPVFRAENSNTHRHLTEFTGLDLEMTLDQHYHEALRMIDSTLKHIFSEVYGKCRQEIELVKTAYPSEDLVWIDETPVLTFAEGIKMLTDSGWTDDDGEPPSPYEDLGTRDEIQLGKLVKEKYHTDYFILDKFPASARPFYTMLDPDDERLTNSFDIFVRGQEILTGGQRIHDAKMLEDRMVTLGVQPSGALREYVKGFRYGCPPHAGAGIGLERIVLLILNLPDIRHASMFPRDPRSLAPDFEPPKLRHPECDTMHPPWESESEPPTTQSVINQRMPLEKLIANYGDASNTSWTDDRYLVWRHPPTGAAVGYVRSSGFAIIVGDPLCHPSQYTEVIHAFLPFVRHEAKLKPIWILVSGPVEGILGSEMGWRCMSCVAEERADPVENRAKEDQAVGKKVRHAKKEGVKIIEIGKGEEVPPDLQRKCDEKLKEWIEGRKKKGKQVHLTDVKPWRDQEHRLYFIATAKAKPRQSQEGKETTSENDGEDEVHALVVLTQLAPSKGFQVKWALDFPGAPSGTIEYAVLEALDAAAAAGASSVTFGAGARAVLEPMHGFSNSNLILKSMEHIYQALATELKLMGKSEFRSKMGAVDDPVFICFPKRTMGPRGLKALMNFFSGGDE